MLLYVRFWKYQFIKLLHTQANVCPCREERKRNNSKSAQLTQKEISEHKIYLLETPVYSVNVLFSFRDRVVHLSCNGKFAIHA